MRHSDVTFNRVTPVWPRDGLAVSRDGCRKVLLPLSVVGYSIMYIKQLTGSWFLHAVTQFVSYSYPCPAPCIPPPPLLQLLRGVALYLTEWRAFDCSAGLRHLRGTLWSRGRSNSLQLWRRDVTHYPTCARRDSTESRRAQCVDSRSRNRENSGVDRVSSIDSTFNHRYILSFGA